MSERGSLTQFQENIISLIRSIDSAIERFVPNWGRNVLIYDLPSVFTGVPDGVSSADCQRIIYAGIITSLKERGFDVGIVLDKKQSMLYVAWSVTMKDSDLNKLTQVIKSVRLIDEPAITQFRRGSDISASTSTSTSTPSVTD